MRQIARHHASVLRQAEHRLTPPEVPFNGLREARANDQAYDAEARRRLHALSLELTGLSAKAAAGVRRL